MLLSPLVVGSFASGNTLVCFLLSLLGTRVVGSFGSGSTLVCFLVDFLAIVAFALLLELVASVVLTAPRTVLGRLGQRVEGLRELVNLQAVEGWWWSRSSSLHEN